MSKQCCHMYALDLSVNSLLWLSCTLNEHDSVESQQLWVSDMNPFDTWTACSQENRKLPVISSHFMLY